MKLNNPSLLKQAAFINGQWQLANNKEIQIVYNPANESVIGSVPLLGVAETRHAIEMAAKAQLKWKEKTGKERSKILRNWHSLLLENIQDLAMIMTCEQGKPLIESQGEIASGLDYLEWFAEESKRIYGDIIPAHMSDKRLLVIKQPIGVVAAITPWNFPHSMISRKAAPALASGCAIIVKPALETPFSALAMAQLAQQAGIPDGIFNVITGNASVIGNELTTNNKIKKLSFTGSTQVGKLLMQQCANTVKKFSMELGGNAPFIVFDDANIDLAVTGALASKFRNSGQTCVCANRFFVQNNVYDEFVSKLITAIKNTIKIGNGINENINQGPLINNIALQNAQSFVDDAIAKGAHIATGGNEIKIDGRGYFFAPTVITNVNNTMRLAKEEIFAPIAPIFKFENDEEAIAMANNTEYGLAGYFYSQNLSRVWRVAEAMETGMVGVNSGMLTTEVAPFGGIKESGIGREGSKYGIDEYVNIKYICLDVN